MIEPGYREASGESLLPSTSFDSEAAGKAARARKSPAASRFRLIVMDYFNRLTLPNRVTFSASNSIVTDGHAATGPALCAADAAKISLVHHGGRALTGAGHRRQHGHLHARPSTHSGIAAGEASRGTGAADQPGPTLREQHRFQIG